MTKVVIIVLAVAAVAAAMSIARLRARPLSEAQQDALAIADLKKSGVDLRQPRSTDFYLYFASRETAEHAAERLGKAGFQCVVRLGADNIMWLALARKQLVLSPESIGAESSAMKSLATQLGGEFDGWEASK